MAGAGPAVDLKTACVGRDLRVDVPPHHITLRRNPTEVSEVSLGCQRVPLSRRSAPEMHALKKLIRVVQVPTGRRRRNTVSSRAATKVNRATAPTVNGAVIMAVSTHASGCAPAMTGSDSV